MSIFDQIASVVAADFVTGPTVNPQYQAPQRTAAEGEDTRSSAATLCRAWVGLTEEEWEELWRLDCTSADLIDAVEAKLKEKNNG